MELSGYFTGPDHFTLSGLSKMEGQWVQGGEEGGEVEGIERQGRPRWDGEGEGGEGWEFSEGTSWAGISVCLINELEKNKTSPHRAVLHSSPEPFTNMFKWFSGKRLAQNHNRI